MKSRTFYFAMAYAILFGASIMCMVYEFHYLKNYSQMPVIAFLITGYLLTDKLPLSKTDKSEN